MKKENEEGKEDRMLLSCPSPFSLVLNLSKSLSFSLRDNLAVSKTVCPFEACGERGSSQNELSFLSLFFVFGVENTSLNLLSITNVVCLL